MYYCRDTFQYICIHAYMFFDHVKLQINEETKMYIFVMMPFLLKEFQKNKTNNDTIHHCVFRKLNSFIHE